MDLLKVHFASRELAEREIYKYFSIDKIPHETNIGNINDYYWYINDDNYLCYAQTIEEFNSEDYYCLDDGCDDEVIRTYENDGYVGIQVGCGEHRDARFEIFRADKKINIEDLDED